ncbi:hypothetical protein E2C01_011608 [Portunus trituberculatus]|uniref:Uncharacterized protein n=1 Tax=Portunus trituberculatus TaxID=210409 RepID=A0A5B7DCE7_PORTR|nr:hypothetical protein [Portunus trituberculatus]
MLEREMVYMPQGRMTNGFSHIFRSLATYGHTAVTLHVSPYPPPSTNDLASEVQVRLRDDPQRRNSLQRTHNINPMNQHLTIMHCRMIQRILNTLHIYFNIKQQSLTSSAKESATRHRTKSETEPIKIIITNK